MQPVGGGEGSVAEEGERRWVLFVFCLFFDLWGVLQLDFQMQRNAVLERNLSAIYNTAKKELHTKEQVIQVSCRLFIAPFLARVSSGVITRS